MLTFKLVKGDVDGAYTFVGNVGVFSTLKMLVTVSQSEILIYDLDHVIIFPLINERLMGNDITARLIKVTWLLFLGHTHRES